MTAGVVCPAVTVALAGEFTIWKSCPVPVRVITCGLLDELSSSLTVRRPFLVPPAAGVNVTLMVQFLPVSRELHRCWSRQTPGWGSLSR